MVEGKENATLMKWNEMKMQFHFLPCCRIDRHTPATHHFHTQSHAPHSSIILSHVGTHLCTCESAFLVELKAFEGSRMETAKWSTGCISFPIYI